MCPSVGVEHVLQELHAAGLLDAAVATSRSSVKRARDDESGSWSNSYGHMIQHVQVPLEGNPQQNLQCTIHTSIGSSGPLCTTRAGSLLS